MLIRWTIWLTTCLTLFSDVFCDIQEQSASKNLKDFEHTFLENEFSGSESEAPASRVLRATPPGHVFLSKYNLTLLDGTSDSVVCSGDSNKLTWLDYSSKKLKTSSSIKIIPNLKSNQTTLQFSPVKTKHKGTYQCVNEKYNQITQLTVTVYDKPKITISSTSKTYEVGDSFDLTCQANGPNVTWTNGFGAKMLEFPVGMNQVFTLRVPPRDSKTTLLLAFRNVSMAQTGDYRCNLNTLGKEDYKSVFIKVLDASLQFSEKDEKSIKENEEFSITCKGKVSQIWWTHNSKTISLNHQEDENVYVKGTKQDGRMMEQTLRFENMDKSSEGTYVCWGVSNFNGVRMQRSFRLKVIEDNLLSDPIIRSRKPPISGRIAKVQIHNSFTTACIGETENVEWLGPPHFWKIPESNNFLPSGASIYTELVPDQKKKLLLRFRSVTVNDEGKYICRVTKNNVVTEAEFNLTVIIPASFNITQNNSYSANETADVKLECVANGRPKPDILWYKNGKPVSEPKISYDGDSLMIRNVSYENAGKYICEARQPSNDGLTIERAVHLEVHHKPIFPEGNITIERIKNNVSRIECNSVAHPPAHYTWYKDNAVLKTASGVLAENLTNGTIEISLLNYSEYEVLTCNATNSYGSSVQTVNVTAMQMPTVPVVRIFYTSQFGAKYGIAALRNATITQFNVDYREKSDDEWSERNETKRKSDLHVYELEDLKPKTEYVIRVRSVNPIGVSEFSKEVEFKTSLACQITASIGVLLVTLLVHNLAFF